MVTKIIEMHPHKIVPESKPSFLEGRITSFGYAWSGIMKFFATEKNAQVHLGATVMVISMAVLLDVNQVEIIMLVFAIALVWITEMINTAIGKIMDFISVERNNSIKTIKDMAAGAVLMASTAALLTGSIIFIPKLVSLFNRLYTDFRVVMMIE